MPKVTIILPSYNVISYIRQCLDSVISQSLRDIEIICVDAGSTDGTREILNEYASGDSRVQVFHSEKKSYGYQMNLGIREARGEYIGIVETDDYIEPSMYELLYKIAEHHKADIVKAGRYEMYEFADGDSMEEVTVYLPADKKTNETLNPDEDPSLHRWDMNIWNGIYKVEFLRSHEIRFRETDGAAFQDIGFFQTGMNDANRVVYIRNPLYHYRKIRPGASTWNPSCLHYVCDEYRNLLQSEGIKSGHINEVYMAMIAAFFTELDKIIFFEGQDYSKYDQDMDWFENTMKNAIEKKIVRLDDLNDRWRNRLLIFMIDREIYIREYGRGVDILRDWIMDFRKKLGKKQLILFGAGNYGTAMLKFLIRNGIKPVTFADNNVWLRNSTIHNLPILTADEAAVQYPDAFFLICNRNMAGEMKKQLLDWGIQEDQIDIFDGKDKELVRAWREMPVLMMEK